MNNIEALEMLEDLSVSEDTAMAMIRSAKLTPLAKMNVPTRPELAIQYHPRHKLYFFLAA